MVRPRRALAFPWIVAPARLAKGRSPVGSAPRMAPAAVRIPHPQQVELPLRYAGKGPQIFVHEGARQALERRLHLAFGGMVQLSVTDNRRRMVTRTQVNGVLKVRVHMMFLDASERVVDALVRYVVDGDREASEIVGAFIEKNSHRIRATRPARGPLRPRGHVHDLYAILTDVSHQYLGSAAPPDVLITWGRHTQAGGDSRKTIKLGSYSPTERLIRVHPALDKEWVPRYFVSYVVYHELLHHVVPSVKEGGRALLHSAEFNRRERQFRHFERAMEWERRHIHRLLRAR
jgi:hypothetical protein